VGLAGSVRMVDTVCINQNDMHERTEQVQLMGHIYRECREVLVWLGDYTIQSEAPLKSYLPKISSHGNNLERKTVEGMQSGLKTFLEAKSFTRKDLNTFDSQNKDLLAAFVIIYLLSLDQHFTDLPCFEKHNQKLIDSTAYFTGGFRALDSIYLAAYWSRMWVVQEPILPPSATMITCSYSLSWDVFAKAHKYLGKHQTGCCYLERGTWSDLLASQLTRISETMHTICSTYTLLKEGCDADILTLLREYCERKATNPRDKGMSFFRINVFLWVISQ
jgi:hypothetical protein